MNTASLKQDYLERIVPILMKEFNYTTVMQCPKLQKNRPQSGPWRSCG
jgi:large subunit ribosomal protein L5